MKVPEATFGQIEMGGIKTADSDVSVPDEEMALENFTEETELELPELPGIEMIRRIQRKKAINGAIVSMLIWGVINIGIWFFFGAEDREFLSKLSTTDGGLNYLMYGNLALGIGLIAFGLLGGALRNRAAVLFDGFSLISIGIWNSTNTFVAMSVLGNYGYTIQHSMFDTAWIILGICQIGWGFKQLLRLEDLGRIGNEDCDKDEISAAEKDLFTILNAPADPGEGRIKFTERKSSWLPFSSDTIKHYTVWLRETDALCVEGGASEVFTLERVRIDAGGEIANPVVMTREGGAGTFSMALDEESLEVVNNWMRTAV